MFFRGKHEFLSNFHECPVEIMCRDGQLHIFRNSEAAFQAMKSDDPDVIKSFETMSGAQAKKAGKKVKLFCSVEEWNARRVETMKAVINAKFQENPDLMEKLQKVEGPIAEDNNWGDRFWGRVRDKKTGEYTGRNELGKILESIRETGVETEDF